jgi:outer membrane protein assembly factor BamE (lipoprotein component of BamABCDE complex)
MFGAMKRELFISATMAALVVTGCSKTETHPQPKAVVAPTVPAAREPWQIKRDEIVAAVKVGMTEEEVVKAIGEPKRVKSVSGTVPIINWQYELPGGKWLNVRFGKDNRVVAVELDAMFKID